ncbi:protein of unknown function [Geodermatophilus pulveris]|uniref:eCIS core domain-containing protein n=1 Tax=Geodermatophilus pulveris TaxID=1564159 RepID=A0A239C3U3_9ACTN|nr:DUF4157 domain-containing protein [Geodermatophilus pulveris]SNS14084.1 protein of unknown function [Geodermatophilus pulveris]
MSTAVERVTRDVGTPLPASVRGWAEVAVGADLGRVRLHTDAAAVASARAVGAAAFTVGPHVVFGAGRYAPATRAGSRLLAHELTHVAQQAATGHEVLARQPENDPDADVSLGPLDSRVANAVAGELMGETQWAVLREFLRGLWGGMQDAPPEQQARIEAKFSDFDVVDAGKYIGGYALGVGEGLWASIMDIVDAVTTLVQLPSTISDFLQEQAPELWARYGPRLAELLTDLRGLDEQLGAALSYVIEHPRESLDQLTALLESLESLALAQVRALGRGAAGEILAFVEQPWFEFGRSIGKVVGRITFEVALALASGAIGNLVKGAARIAGRLAARVITEAVELLRGAGRLIGQAVEWIRGLARKLVGELGELLDALGELLSRLGELVDDVAGEGALADTGLGVRLPVPESRGLSNVLEARGLPPRRSPATVADLSPPRVHPSGPEVAPSTQGPPTTKTTASEATPVSAEDIPTRHPEPPGGPKRGPAPKIREEDVTTGPHGPERPLEDVISRALSRNPRTGRIAGAQGRWLSRAEAERAIADLAVDQMVPGRAYSVPIPEGAGQVVRPYNEYPITGTSPTERIMLEPADRAVVIRKEDGIHTFPIGPEHAAYDNPAPTR